MKSLSRIAVPILSILAIVLALYCLSLGRQQNIKINESIELSKLINNKIGTPTNLDSLKNEIVQLKFEKESYTTHLALMSDWFILFVTVLFGIFFVVGYGVFDNKIAQEKKENEAAYERINGSHIKFENEFKELKIEHYEYAGNLFVSTAYLLKENQPFAFMMKLRASNFFVLSDRLRGDPSESFDVIKANLIDSENILKELKNKTELFDMFFKDDNNLKSIEESLNNILLVDNFEIKGLCAGIYSLFKSLTNDMIVRAEKGVKTSN